MYRIEENSQFKSREVYFDEKPSVEIRENLKALKMRWHNVKKCWYGFASAEDIAAAIDGVPVVDFEIPEAVAVDEGTLYAGWAGGNCRTWRSDKELKAFLLEDFKRAGIRCSVRFNRAGYLTSITCTLTVKAEEVRSFEEWKAVHGELYIKPGFWYDYTDENGKACSLFGERFYDLDPNGEEAATIRAAIEHSYYTSALHSFQYDNISATGSRAAELLKPAALARLETVQKIVDSYNRDCSNSMIDYFDRDIYDHYSIKIA